MMELFQKLVMRCKKCRSCHHYHASNGTFKKISGVTRLKFVHDKYKTKAMENNKDNLANNLRTALRLYPNLKDRLDSATEDLLPTKVLQLFKNIPLLSHLRMHLRSDASNEFGEERRNTNSLVSFSSTTLLTLSIWLR